MLQRLINVDNPSFYEAQKLESLKKKLFVQRP